ncbi:uncharacterized protein LOC110693088 [Chenopodium quinoa]|uniref:uncharacterized protein LOC110693088 n=1 Tax=Chenopodium quinoa TaxID=63459 RepID=UPI000B783275|nr:uncharacterized protein LOC110693088 [Chenopodium quinoa]
MENGRVKNATAPTSPDKEQPPIIRSVISLKNKKRIREIEMVEDCFILDFDPYESSSKPTSPSQFVDQDDDAPDFKVIAQRGKCHCYVCDVAAPCAEWSDHCDADHVPYSDWWYLRRKKRGQDYESDSDSDYFE